MSCSLWDSDLEWWVGGTNGLDVVVELLGGVTLSSGIVWDDGVESSVIVSVGWIAGAALGHGVLSVFAGGLSQHAVGLWSSSDDVGWDWASAAWVSLHSEFSDWELNGRNRGNKGHQGNVFHHIYYFNPIKLL